MGFSLARLVARAPRLNSCDQKNIVLQRPLEPLPSSVPLAPGAFNKRIFIAGAVLGGVAFGLSLLHG